MKIREKEVGNGISLKKQVGPNPTIFTTVVVQS